MNDREERILAPAKINLYLRVLGRRPDGYHLLDSLIVPINIFDEVSLKLSSSHGSKSAITLSSNGFPVPDDASNLAYRAAELFIRSQGRPLDATVHIDKRIPVGSGLGGGSSDAAAVLLSLNRLLGSPLENKELVALGSELGADVAFFLAGYPAQVEGIGERLTPIEGWKPLPLVVCFDGFCLSTKLVYSQVDLSLTSGRLASNISDFVSGRKPISELLVNDLERAATKIYPAVLRLKAKLMEQGALGALMTGSGSAVFGVWSDAELAQAAAARLRQQGLWAQAVRTLDSSPAAVG